MHPSLTGQMWPHVHQDSTHHAFTDKMHKWLHNENFWTVIGLMLMVGLMLLSIYVTIRMGPMDIAPNFGTPPGVSPVGQQPLTPWM